jgi:hypothetical protein
VGGSPDYGCGGVNTMLQVQHAFGHGGQDRGRSRVGIGLGAQTLVTHAEKLKE